MSIILNWKQQPGQNLSQVTLIDSAEKVGLYAFVLVLVRGSAPTDSSITNTSKRSGSAYQGKGFLCQERDPESGIPNKQMLPNWTNISPASIYGDDLEYGRCEYNDFVYPFGDCTDGDEPTVMTLDESLRNADHQSGLFEWQGDTYRMRLLRGLVYGVDGFGPDNGRGDLAGVDSGGRFNSTLYSWNDIYNAGLTGTLIMNKFYRHGKVYYMMNEQMTYDALPAGFRALTGMSGDQINYSDTDDLAFLGQLPFETVGSPQKSIVIKNRRGVGGVETVILNTRYWYLLTVTVNGRTAALPAPIATLSNGETEWTDKNENPAGSIVNIYRGTAKINPRTVS
ncbi:hypothetical protein SPFM10_00130 [Salmonella phage SPFM10]|nr:hypothetical protein SPFM10_00130 [Salmonella phage SPFM10]